MPPAFPTSATSRKRAGPLGRAARYPVHDGVLRRDGPQIDVARERDIGAGLRRTQVSREMDRPLRQFSSLAGLRLHRDRDRAALAAALLRDQLGTEDGEAGKIRFIDAVGEDMAVGIRVTRELRRRRHLERAGQRNSLVLETTTWKNMVSRRN